MTNLRNSLVKCLFLLALSTHETTFAEIAVEATKSALIINGRQFIDPVYKFENGKKMAYWFYPGKGYLGWPMKPGQIAKPLWVTVGEVDGIDYPISDIDYTNKIVRWYKKGGRGLFTVLGDGNVDQPQGVVQNRPTSVPLPKPQPQVSDPKVN